MALLLQKPATKNATFTASHSTTMMKNMFRAALSAVAYLRSIFDDDVFELSRIGGTRYHKIAYADVPDVKRYADWIEKGIFDALQRGFLEVVLLEIFEESPSNLKKKKGVKCKLLERYTFTITYADGNAQLSVTGNGRNKRTSGNPKENIKQNAGQVLRSLVQLTSSLDPLPPKFTISMKLLYTKNTPPEYEPPMFRKAPDGELSWSQETPLCKKVGTVMTPFHQLLMTIQAGANTDGKENIPRDDKDGEQKDFSEDKEGQQEEVENNNHISDGDWIQDTGLMDCGSCNADSGRVGKKFLAESDDVEVRTNKTVSVSKQKPKKATKTKRAPARKGGKAAKTTHTKKRKASVSEADINRKRQRGKGSA